MAEFGKAKMLWICVGFRTMGFLHGLLVLCRYLIASLCAFGGGPLLPGRHPSMDGGGGGDGTSLCSNSWL